MRLTVLALALVVALVGCGAGAPAVPDATPFIAFDSTFQTYRSWPSVHSDGPPDDGTFAADVLGPRTQYLNQRPPHGATKFPVGTIIVEEREDSGTTFAGVKRGGGFNETGARGWEWFELSQAASGQILIVWRGAGPPINTMYGGDPNSGCNPCHKACGAGNDFVCSPKLQLKDF